MEKIRIGLVGCGGMGTRHIYGIRELSQTPFDRVELAAVCDIDRDTAELAASEAEELLGSRPPVYTDLETMGREVEMHAVDIVTEAAGHHRLACAAMEMGLHVMVEKPMAITVKACRLMMETAERHDRILSVAENYRRDPSARLVHHLLQQGAIGRPYMATMHLVSGGNDVYCTAWRHLKEEGGVVLDVGVHFTDLIRYQLGEVAEVYGKGWTIEPARIKDTVFGWETSPYAIYRKRFADLPAEIPVTCEDNSMAMMRMESGLMVNWMCGAGGHGGVSGQLILGDRGVIKGFGNRGSKVVMQRSGEEEMQHEEIVANVEGFSQEPLADHFFPDCVTAGNSDWRTLALEYHELAEAILDGREIEVTGEEGMRDVAALYAVFESSVAGKPVSVRDVEACEQYDYQGPIDAALGIS